MNLEQNKKLIGKTLHSKFGKLDDAFGSDNDKCKVKWPYYPVSLKKSQVYNEVVFSDCL